MPPPLPPSLPSSASLSDSQQLFHQSSISEWSVYLLRRVSPSSDCTENNKRRTEQQKRRERVRERHPEAAQSGSSTPDHGEYSAVCTCSPPSTQCRGSCFLTDQCVGNTAVRWAQCGTHSKDSHQEDALSAFTALLSGRQSVLCERLCL